MMGAGMRLSLFVSISYGDALRRAFGDLDKMQTKTARKRVQTEVHTPKSLYIARLTPGNAKIVIPIQFPNP